GGRRSGRARASSWSAWGRGAGWHSSCRLGAVVVEVGLGRDAPHAFLLTRAGRASSETTSPRHARAAVPDNRRVGAERRREVTRAAVREFEEALAHLDEDARGSTDWVRRGLRAGMESQLADLRAELAGLEATDEDGSGAG